MAKNVRLQPESIFSLILAALGLFIVVVSLVIGFGTLKNPGSGLFPFLVGLLVCIQSLIVLFKQKRRGHRPSFNTYEIKNLLLMSITFILWMVLMPYLGYLFVTFVVVFSFCKILRLEGWIKPLVLSICTTGLCYLLFGYLLYLDLPRGFLG